MIFAFTPPLIACWSRWRRQGRTFDDRKNVAWLHFACAGLLDNLPPPRGPACPLHQLARVVLYFAVLTIAELNFRRSAFRRINMASNASRSTVMGIWLATSFLGNIAAG